MFDADLVYPKHFSAGVPYAAPYAHKYIQVSAINVLKTNQNIIKFIIIAIFNSFMSKLSPLIRIIIK